MDVSITPKRGSVLACPTIKVPVSNNRPDKGPSDKEVPISNYRPLTKTHQIRRYQKVTTDLTKAQVANGGSSKYQARLLGKTKGKTG